MDRPVSSIKYSKNEKYRELSVKEEVYTFKCLHQRKKLLWFSLIFYSLFFLLPAYSASFLYLQGLSLLAVITLSTFLIVYTHIFPILRTLDSLRLGPGVIKIKGVKNIKTLWKVRDHRGLLFLFFPLMEEIIFCVGNYKAIPPKNWRIPNNQELEAEVISVGFWHPAIKENVYLLLNTSLGHVFDQSPTQDVQIENRYFRILMWFSVLIVLLIGVLLYYGLK